MLFCMYGLIVDGEFKGIFQIDQIIRMFSEWNSSGHQLLDAHIHHFLYNKIKNITALLEAFNTVPIKVFTHDYYIACSNYNLLKNKESFCGGQGLKDEYCLDCTYYEKSKEISGILHKFFAKFEQRITFVSPCECTRTIISRFYPEYAEKIRVIPHQTYTQLYKENLTRKNEDEKIKVGFLGMPAKHKGWDIWLDIIKSTPKDKYEYVVFNNFDGDYTGMKKVEVSFSEKNINAMTDALRLENVDTVILWSICAETYSYTCYEAFSSNAFIITNSISGNIADVVRANKNGIVLNSKEELLNLFTSYDKLYTELNNFKTTTSGGPLELYPNDEIVKISLSNMADKQIAQNNNSFKYKLINYPLLKLLNYLYEKGKI